MKKARVKSSKSKKNPVIYGLCAVGMIVLFVTAFFLPQMIFTIQDQYRISDTEVQARNSLDISQLDMAYEQDLNARLKYYINMKNKIVTAIDYDFTEDPELDELLESIFQEEWFVPLFYSYGGSIKDNYTDVTNYRESFAPDITECKKYLIHGASYQDDVALMMWYFDLNLESIDTRIRLLVDSESSTVYYVKISTTDEKTIGKMYHENIHYMLDLVQAYYDYYSQYYDADPGLSYSEYLLNGKMPWFVQTIILDDAYIASMNLTYGELGIEFRFQFEYTEDSNYEITMGLPDIGEMIPKMIQD